MLLALPQVAISDHHEFTIGVLPDTQTYTALRPQIMEAQIDWITANRVLENIVYVAHLGDLKDIGACVNATLAWPSLASPSTEWQIVRRAFDELDTAGIPYGVTPGNHDFDQRNGVFPADSGGCPNYDPQRPLVGYNGEFPPSSFPVSGYGSRDPSGISNEDNYTTVSSNGIDFLFINLGYQEDAPAAGSTGAIDWAETIITTFPNHIAIVTSHFLLECNDSTTGGGGGANGSCAATPDYNLSTYASNIVTRLRAYQNFFMLIGGHRFGESYVAIDRSAEGFNPVHLVLANYQHLQYSATDFETVSIPGPAGGSSGYFKLMRFDVDTMTVDLDSLSPSLGAFGGISGSPPAIQDVLSNGDRPTVVFSPRDIDPNVPANLVDVGGNPTLHTQSVSNLVNISFAGYVDGATTLFDVDFEAFPVGLSPPFGVGSDRPTGTQSNLTTTVQDAASIFPTAALTSGRFARLEEFAGEAPDLYFDNGMSFASGTFEVSMDILVETDDAYHVYVRNGSGSGIAPAAQSILNVFHSGGNLTFTSYSGTSTATAISTVVPQATATAFNLYLSFDLDTLTYDAEVDGVPVVTGVAFNTGRSDFPVPQIGRVIAGFEFTSFTPQPSGFDGVMQIDNILMQHTP